jgi:ERCC4-type nuclease
LKQSINIVVDDRERSQTIRQVLTSMEGVTCRVQRLAIGDFHVDGRLVFERKTLPDFALSIIDGRLFRQMTRLTASRMKGILVLEGKSSDLRQGEVQREALQGALITTSLVLGIPVLRALNSEETARLMVYAGRQVRRVAGGGLPRSGYRPRGKRKQQLYILQSLPGVGPARAACLLERFGSVQNVLNAGLEDLKAVDGIGATTARNIRWVIRESQAPYGAYSDTFFSI